MLRSMLAALCLVFAILALRPAPCLADEGDRYGRSSGPPEVPSLLSYGFKGFWLGAEVGVAVGFLAMGPSYRTGEWKKLVFGAGLGALTGVCAGVALAMVDTGNPPPPIGWYILRDAGYGTLLGALSGAAVGALFVLDSGKPRDILTGASIGSLAGTVVGVAFGVIEYNASFRRRDSAERARELAREQPRLRFTLNAISAPGPRTTLTTLTWLPGVAGQF